MIGTDDTLASPGAQVAYYQSGHRQDRTGAVDAFARFFVIPRVGHGLSGRSYTVDGDGKTVASQAIPNTYDRLGAITDWVENKKTPEKSITVKAGERSLPMCSYPAYPKYVRGPAVEASSYTCSAR